MPAEEGPVFVGRRRYDERRIREKERALKAQVRSTLAYPSVRSLPSRYEKIQAVQQDPNVRAKAEQLDAAIRLADRHGIPMRSHNEPHTDPSHHVGSCGAECRAGRRFHLHRSRRGG